MFTSTYWDLVDFQVWNWEQRQCSLLFLTSFFIQSTYTTTTIIIII